MQGIEARVFAPLHINRYLETLKGDLSVGFSLPRSHPKLFRFIRQVNNILARHAIKRFKPDIIHETYYTKVDFCPKQARRVLTVHDLIHERFPELFDNSLGTTRPKSMAAHRADHVICISESTRRDLVEFLGVPEEKTSVVYHGVDAQLLQTFKPFQLFRPRPFFLYVGARDGYKNFEGMLRAFACSERLRREFDLLCFGGGPLKSNELELMSAVGMRPDQVLQIAGDDDILAALYHQATAFIYPSLHEGFGIPPLEAMCVGCPVVCSNSSSLPEVVGEAAETFDPLDGEAMQAAMERVVFSSSRRSALIAAGRVRSSMFTWEKCAQETEAVYRQLM